MKRFKFIAVAVVTLAGYGVFELLSLPPPSEPSDEDIVELDQPQFTDAELTSTARPSQSAPLPQVTTELEQLPSSPAIGTYVPQEAVQIPPSAKDL